jgi:hypothetical protein
MSSRPPGPAITSVTSPLLPTEIGAEMRLPSFGSDVTTSLNKSASPRLKVTRNHADGSRPKNCRFTPLLSRKIHQNVFVGIRHVAHPDGRAVGLCHRHFARRGQCRAATCRRPATRQDAAPPLVQPQLGDVPRILLQLAALDLLDDVGEDRIGAAGHTELLALAHDVAVDELDLGAPALVHVLPH